MPPRTVNIVFNDYRNEDDDAVFKPFFELAQQQQQQNGGLNGTAAAI